MRSETIKIDIAFPDFGTDKLKEKLNRGWVILDKTVMDGRYVFYVLRETDPDVGKCSNSTKK